MPKTRAQKEETVTKLTDKIARAKTVVFTDYRGLTMAQLSILRNELIDQESEFSITKNNLLSIALKNSQIKVNDDIIEGPTATLFAFGDEINPIKSLTKLIKELKIGTIKGGIFNGESIDKAGIEKLASLPSKEELRAKVVGSLGSPLYGIVGVLQANLRNLVYALDQIRQQKAG